MERIDKLVEHLVDEGQIGCNLALKNIAPAVEDYKAASVGVGLTRHDRANTCDATRDLWGNHIGELSVR